MIYAQPVSRATFAAAIRIEQQANYENYEKEARSTLEDQLRLGTIIGPMLIDSVNGNTITGKPYPRHPFNIGKFTPKDKLTLIFQTEIAVPNLLRKSLWTIREDGTCKTDWKENYEDAPKVGEVFYLIKEMTDYLDEFAKRLLKQANNLRDWPGTQVCDSMRKSSPPVEETARDRALATCLNPNIPLLLIKGPPGTGKTDLLAEVAGTLVQKGKSVLVLSTSHDAVDNALDKIRARFDQDAIEYVVKHPKSGDQPCISDTGVIVSRVYGKDFVCDDPDDNDDKIFPKLIGFVLAAAIYKAPESTQTGRVICFDEAGQIPAFNTAALATLGDRLLFFGDEAQLPPITHGAHAPDTFGDRSSMDYLRAVLGAKWSIALDRTWRMNREICGLIQRHFYPDVPTLQPEPQGNPDAHLIAPDGQRIPALIQHALASETPCLSLNPPEVDQIVTTVRHLLKCKVVLGKEAPRPLLPSEIAILTPFRQQAGAIAQALVRHNIPNLQQVGTVDKMQGQDASVVIYSLAAANLDYIATQGDFLFSSHRWNVALSRAKAHAIVIGDIEAHRNALPTTLAGIDAQSRILNMLDDPAWTKQ